MKKNARKLFQRLLVLGCFVMLLFGVTLEPGHAQGNYCAASGGYVMIGNRQVFVCPYQGGSDPCLYMCPPKQ